MDTYDLALISVISVLILGYMTMVIALFGIWIGTRNEARETRTELKEEIRALGARVDAASERVSDAELEQARMQGVMSVIQAQSHSHDAPPTSGGPRAPSADD